MFNIPKRNYKGDKSEAIAVRLPDKMLKAIENSAEELGLSSNELMSIILDQFIAALKGRKSLPIAKETYEKGKLKTVTIRLSEALFGALDKAAEDIRPKQKRSQIVIAAFDCYLCETL